LLPPADGPTRLLAVVRIAFPFLLFVCLSVLKTAADHESLSERMYPIWKRLLEYDQGMHPEDLEESEKQWKPYFDSAEAKLRS